MVEIEKVNGTDEGDALTGDDFGNTLFGFEGDDFISGLAGDDFLAGREGFDTLDGSDDCVDGEANSNCEFEYGVRYSPRHHATVVGSSGHEVGGERPVWTNSLRTPPRRCDLGGQPFAERINGPQHRTAGRFARFRGPSLAGG